MSRRLVLAVLALTLGAVPLTGCGKKGAPSLPAGEVSSYPHAYPAGAVQQNATPSVPTGQPVEPPDAAQPPPGTVPNAKPNK